MEEWMSQFNGRKCDNCGKEDRNEVHELNSLLQAETSRTMGLTADQESPQRQADVPWMRIWWRKDFDFCPSCARVVNDAINFARKVSPKA
jgi:hypothetical protein